MLQLPEIPFARKPLTIEEFNRGRNRALITERSLRRYEFFAYREYEWIIPVLAFLFSVAGVMYLWTGFDLADKNSREIVLLLVGSLSISFLSLPIALPITHIVAFPITYIIKLIFNYSFTGEKEFLRSKYDVESCNSSYNRELIEIAKKLSVGINDVEDAYNLCRARGVYPFYIECFHIHNKLVEPLRSFYNQKARKSQADYWRRLGGNGREFEVEVYKHFLRKGYVARLTSQNNDGGVDIVLTKDGHTTYVQCKQYSKPIGITVARELLGVMSANNVTSGIIATIEGANKNTNEFCGKNGIKVLDVWNYVSENPAPTSIEINNEEFRCSYLEHQDYKYNDVWISGIDFCEYDKAVDYVKKRKEFESAAIIEDCGVFGVLFGKRKALEEVEQNTKLYYVKRIVDL